MISKNVSGNISPKKYIFTPFILKVYKIKDIVRQQYYYFIRKNILESNNCSININQTVITITKMYNIIQKISLNKFCTQKSPF